MNKEALRAQDLVWPSVAKILVALSPQERKEFHERFSNLFPGLFEKLRQLYGHRWDFFFHLQLLAQALAEAWVARDQDLKALDRTRAKDSQWFRRESMVGAMVYVDLFAKDLAGFRKKIAYFEELGVTYLHLMPLFLAPKKENDGGYAVSDYRQVNPTLGTMEELRILGAELRAKGISLVLDFIFNHTSNEHFWAQEAMAGKDEYRDYYWIFSDKSEADSYNRTLRDIFPDARPGSFSFVPQVDGWVWTTFNTYQWDLNYQNPAVFIAMVKEMLFLANSGAEILRLDALAFCWKELGTTCENLPKAHTLIQCFHAAAAISAPAMAFKSEAIVHPDEVIKYVSKDECEISYNPLLMALLWETLATRNTDLLRVSMQKRFAIPGDTAWVNYIRSHDDIGWTFADEDAWELGINPQGHRRFLNDFYIGEFPGSFSRGVPFQYNPLTGDCRVSGTAASLSGLEKSLTEIDPQVQKVEEEMALARLLALHGIIMTIGGIPVIYLGDENAQMNDYTYAQEPGKSKDSRWVHRPAFDWKKKSWNARIRLGIQKMIDLRRSYSALGTGSTQVIDVRSSQVFAFVRDGERRRIFVITNMTERPAVIPGNELRVQGFYPLAWDGLTGEKVPCDQEFLTLGPYQQWWLIPGEPELKS